MTGKDQDNLTDWLDEILNAPEMVEKIKEGERLMQSGELQKLIDGVEETLSGGKRKYTLSNKALYQRQAASKRPRTQTKRSPNNLKTLYREATTLCNTIRKVLRRFESKFLQVRDSGT